ncbi:MAG TPA: hypothetical protein PKD37_01395 [Oligoflexia bacterium]|nr:hypothetical protein [Oligoflexia bacterium]HMP26631.1 hypothetical protein [Oligoflexia bacterium]
MKQGVIDYNSIAEIIRGISSRKHNGELRIEPNDHLVTLLFFKGRLVDVIDSKADSTAQLLDKLAQLGYSTPPDRDIQGLTFGSVVQMVFTINEKLTAEKLTEIFKELILDRLTAIDLSVGKLFEFENKVVEFEREFAPQLMVGQILIELDIVRTDAKKFAEDFPGDKLLQIEKEALRIYTNPFKPIEEQIIDLLIGGPLPVSILRSRTIASLGGFISAIQSLCAKGLLVVPDQNIAQNKSAEISEEVAGSSAIEQPLNEYRQEGFVSYAPTRGLNESELVKIFLLNNICYLYLFVIIFFPFIAWINFFDYF